jgi:hypothetical protein
MLPLDSPASCSLDYQVKFQKNCSDCLEIFPIFFGFSSLALFDFFPSFSQAS